MQRILTVTLGLFLIFAGIQAAEEQRDHHPQPPADPRFEFLKSLEGTWTGPPLSEGMPGGVFEFRVTAGGHAVEEREMIGTPMEMLTVYHMEGDDLMATHYCMLGNQPRAKAAREVVDDGLGFGCDGRPGNSASHEDKHVHGWSMQLDDQGRLHYTAEILERDEVAEAPSFILTRRSAS